MTSENKGKVKEDETVLFSDLTNEGLDGNAYSEEKVVTLR